jgi:hypothetical protein
MAALLGCDGCRVSPEGAERGNAAAVIVAVYTPLRDQPEPLYVQSLNAMMEHTAQERPDMRLHYAYRRGGLIENRNFLAEQAVGIGADWHLLIDADMTFPRTGLIDLLSHGLPLVGCNYPTRSNTSTPTAFSSLALPLSERRWPPLGASGIEPVDGFGFGFCLIAAEVFAALERPWFTARPPTDVTEDYQFCTDAVAKGFQPYLDEALSWDIGHIHRGQVLRLADVVRWRAERFASKLPELQRVLSYVEKQRKAE